MSLGKMRCFPVFWQGVLGMLVASASFLPASVTAQQTEQSIQFKPLLLTVDANEGIDLADVNRDGSLDVIAGRNWFAAPDFKPRPLRAIEDWNGYVQSNGDHAMDVDGDGWIDVVAGSFLPSEVYWFRNPGKDGLERGQLWKANRLVDTKISQNEISFLHDFDGDQKPEWIFNSWKAQNPVVVWKFETVAPKQKKQPATQVLTKHVIGKATHGHGMGFGDVNQDGREDVLVATGWYERPAEKPLEQAWKFHPDWNLPHASCPILVRDLNRDGKNDLIWGNGHDFGLQWLEATGEKKEGKLQFKPHMIDDSFSQAHAIHFADLDDDGTDELITGKRLRGHNGRDPGGKAAACMYYYQWNATSNSFQRHTIDEGHVGTGLQIRSRDIDQDGDIDLAVAGKDGTWILFNQRK